MDRRRPGPRALTREVSGLACVQRGPRQIPAHERAAASEQRTQLARELFEERSDALGVGRHLGAERNVGTIDILGERRSHDEEVANRDRCSGRRRSRCGIVRLGRVSDPAADPSPERGLVDNPRRDEVIGLLGNDGERDHESSK